MLKELLKQKRELDVQITVAKAVEQVEAINHMIDICRELGIDPATIGKNKRTAPKFYNNQTGDTWTGVGRMPVWFDSFDCEAISK